MLYLDLHVLPGVDRNTDGRKLRHGSSSAKKPRGALIATCRFYAG